MRGDRRRVLNRLVALMLGLVLAVAACSDSDEGSGTTTTVDATTTTTLAPTTTAAPTTTTNPTTTTTAPPTTTTSTAPQPTAAGYVVVDVADDDVLNVRSGPSVENGIVATLPPDATGVITTGFGTTNLGDDAWWEVVVDGTVGWVNSTFLALPPTLTVPLADQPCGSLLDGGTGATSDADHVMALAYERSTACNRFTVFLGTDAYAGEPVAFPFTPAAALPAGVEVGAEGAVVTVELPAQVQFVRQTASEADYGDALAFVTRGEDRNLEVKLHYAGRVTAQAFLLAGPARVVVDVVEDFVEDEASTLPIVGGLTAVFPIDPIDEGVVPPIAIRGYGRPFEAQGDVELYELTDGPPGSGDPVNDAVWDGIGGRVTDFGTGYMTTDWTEAWGQFEVTLVDVPEGGSYELFVGELSPADGEPVGVYLPLAIIKG